MIRDGDRIFSNRFDETLETIGIQSILSHRQLRRNLLDFQHYYNQSRPHSSLGPGIPDIPVRNPFVITPSHQSQLGVIRSIPHLGGLHHNYIPMAA